MFNISKQGSSLLITSNDNSQFPWKDGQMSLPMNSVVYVIDESDYIAFRSASNNDILFTALIDEIQINGTNVTKDDFILQFDNVANSAGGGGGSASAGVNSINGFQGDLTLKTVNGNSLIGSGNIEISGGEPEQYIKMLGEEYPNNLIWYTNEKEDYREIKFKTINGNPIMGEGDITIEGGGGSSEPEQYVKSVTTDNAGSIYINNNDGTSDRIVFPLINGQNLVGNGGNIEISGGSSEPEQYIVSIENFWMYTKEEPYKKLWLQYIDSSDKNSITTKEIILEWTGTQSEYDALGEYDDSITYNIIEG